VRNDGSSEVDSIRLFVVYVTLLLLNLSSIFSCIF
jgi:hypothetical protein